MTMFLNDQVIHTPSHVEGCGGCGEPLEWPHSHRFCRQCVIRWQLAWIDPTPDPDLDRVRLATKAWMRDRRLVAGSCQLCGIDPLATDVIVRHATTQSYDSWLRVHVVHTGCWFAHILYDVRLPPPLDIRDHGGYLKPAPPAPRRRPRKRSDART